MTLAPLPLWRDLFRALFFSPLDDDQLSAPWRKSGDISYWYSRTSMSLVIIVFWWKSLHGKAAVNVWFPGYFCNESLQPLRATGVSIIFYPILEDLSPDLYACEQLAKGNKPNLFIIVHYLGEYVEGKLFIEFCKKNDCWLIEDATHLLMPENGESNFGDCILYSPHKHLPIAEGGLLVIRPDGPSQLTLNLSAMRVLDEINQEKLTDLKIINLGLILWLIKRIFQKLGLRKKSAISKSGGAINLQDFKMSYFSKKMLTPLLPKLNEVTEIRKNNSSYWSCIFFLLGANLSNLINNLKFTPYLKGVNLSNDFKLKEIYDELLNNGIPKITWPDLPPEVIFHPKELHSLALDLTTNKFYLPVHQTISTKDIFRYGFSLLNSQIKNWNLREVSKDYWESCWREIKGVNLLQSWEYGEAKKSDGGWDLHRFIIEDQFGRQIALVQTLVKKFPLIGGVVRINRGPLLLIDSSDTSKVSYKIMSLGVLLRKSFGTGIFMIKIAPELDDGVLESVGLKMLGFKKLPDNAWQSGKINLEVDEHKILMSFDGKWRNQLRKGLNEKLVIHIQEGTEIADFNSLVNEYTLFKSKKSFEGLSEKLLSALGTQQGQTWKFNIFIAHETNEYGINEQLGVLISVHTGDTATYLIGFTNDSGRNKQVNSVLLWNSILHAKRCCCNWFDIGGLGNSTPDGIRNFKMKLNAQPYKLIGEWQKWIIQ